MCSSWSFLSQTCLLLAGLQGTGWGGGAGGRVSLLHQHGKGSWIWGQEDLPIGPAVHCEVHACGNSLHFFLCCLFPTLGALICQAASLLYRSEPLSTGTQQNTEKGKVNEHMALSMMAAQARFPPTSALPLRTAQP